MSTRRSIPAGTLAILLAGCYVGFDAHGNPIASGEPAEGGDDSDGGDAHDDDTGGDDEPSGACESPTVGATPLQRLTRAEYDYTVADLLGIESHPASALPPDGVSGLFANNGQTAVSNYTVEVYRDLAEQLAAEAIVDLPALLPCDPVVVGEDACAEAFVSEFGRRAFRRDLDASQVARMLGVYHFGRDGGTFAEGIGLVIEALLQSPSFLYRIESGIPADGEEQLALDDFELAARLSYFLWRSMPDDELLDAASSGALSDRQDVEMQVRRMLEDPRAERALLSFYGDLFALDTLAAAYKDPELFPDFSTELADDMRTELELFVLSGLREGDARLESLLAGNHSFVNTRLATHYGIPAPTGDEFVRVELDPTKFRGLLAKPILMALASHDQRTSPTLRGKLVRTRLFCQQLPPPPDDVNTTIPTLGEQSTREWVQERLDNPNCSPCHDLMDPIGLAFEQLDPVGQWRTEEAGETIDASGSLVGTDVDGDFVGAAGLAEKLLASEAVGECVSQQWFEFGFGREPTSDDACTHDLVAQRFAESDSDLTELMVAIATSDAFRTRRPTTAEDDP